MQTLYDEVLLKNKWIRQATGLDHDLTSLEQTWAKFCEKISDFDTLLAEQLKHLKSLIKGRTSDLRDLVGKYEGKTMSIMLPSNRSEMAEFMEQLQQFRTEENQLKEKITALVKDCEQFELEVPEITLKEVQWAGWDTLMTFSTELGVLEN